MKTSKIRAFLFLVGLVLVNSQIVNASVVSKVQKFAGDQMSNFNLQGLVVIGGIVAASLIVYIVSNYTIKDKEEAVFRQKKMEGKHNHGRHRHVRQIVKKTS